MHRAPGGRGDSRGPANLRLLCQLTLGSGVRAGVDGAGGATECHTQRRLSPGLCANTDPLKGSSSANALLVLHWLHRPLCRRPTPACRPLWPTVGAGLSAPLPAQQLCDCPSMPGTTSGCLWPKTAGLWRGEGDRGWHTALALPCGVQPVPCGKSCLMPTGPPFDPVIGGPLRLWGSPPTPHHPVACL